MKADRRIGIGLCLVVTIVALSHGSSPAPAAKDDAVEARTPSAEDLARLRSILPGIHDIWVRPDLEPTIVKSFHLGIRHISVNEMQSTVSVSAWLRMEWVDQRNGWKDAGAGNGSLTYIKELSVRSDQIWHPDIVLKNSLAGKGVSLPESSSATLYPSGRVVWMPSARLEAFCDLDLVRWPFERHVCSLHFGSWTLNRDKLRINESTHTLEFPGQTGEFVVDNVETSYEERLEQGVEQVFDGVIFTISLHREPGTYRAVIFTPATVVIILCLSTFLMPPNATEKVILGGVNAMLICLFLIYFAHSLPVLTNQTPFVVMFYSASLYMVCVSLVAAVIVLNISRQQHSTRLPWSLKRFLTGSLGRALLLGNYIEQTMGVDHGPCASGRSGRSGRSALEEMPVVMHDSMDGAEGSGDASCSSQEIASKAVSPNLEWLLLAAAIDRVLFVLYSLLFIILAIAFHV